MMGGLWHTLVTGDFPGYAFTGVEEDHLFVETVLMMHGLFF